MDKGLAKSFEPLLEKLEKYSRVQRILISTVIFSLIIGGFVYLQFWPKYEEINRLNKQLDNLEAKLETARKNAAEKDKFEAKMKETEAQFHMAMKKLPEKEEIPSLLSSISNSGQQVGLEFLLFEPKAEKKKEFYAEIPVVMNVVGDFHNTALFFDQVARLPRIVNIENIEMAPAKNKDSRELSTKCMAVTYKFIEPSEQKDSAAKKNKGKKSKRKPRKK
jgi:type IV pilus assembly protein PilO